MEMARVSDTQIRFILDKDDLQKKDMDFKDLAFSSDKANKLFKELLSIAQVSLGFELNGDPIVVEAVPLGDGRVMLMVNKVDKDDTRHDRLARLASLEDMDMSMFEHVELTDERYEDSDEDSDEILFDMEDDEEETDSDGDTVTVESEPSPETAKQKTQEELNAVENLLRGIMNNSNRTSAGHLKKDPNEKKRNEAVFYFENISNVIAASHLVRGMYHSTNSLYKNEHEGRLYLYLMCDRDKEEQFRKACAALCEFGDPCRSTYATKHYLDEHFKLIRKDNALQTLSTL